MGAKRATYRAPDFSVPTFLTDRPRRLSLFFESCFFDWPDVMILRPVKFRWTPIIGSRGVVESMPANHRLGSHPQNKNLAEDVEILLPVKSRKFHSVVSEKKSGGYLVFKSAPKTQTWKSLLPFKFRRFQRRSRKCLSQSDFDFKTKYQIATRILQKSSVT